MCKINMIKQNHSIIVIGLKHWQHLKRPWTPVSHINSFFVFDGPSFTPPQATLRQPSGILLNRYTSLEMQLLQLH